MSKRAIKILGAGLAMLLLPIAAHAQCDDDHPVRNGLVSMHVDADGTVVVTENDTTGRYLPVPNYVFDPAEEVPPSDDAILDAILKFIDGQQS